MTNAPVKNAPVQTDENVLVGELGHSLFPRSYISEHKIKQIATEKYKSSGYGITFEDLTSRFPIKRPKAQRSLKHFHARGILFTAKDLISQGIDLIQNTSPQQYFPTCIKADILEGFKKRKNVLVGPTGANLSTGKHISKQPLPNALEYQKAQCFLDVLTQLPFTARYIHKLQMVSFIDKQCYEELAKKEGSINRAKVHEENIGRRHVNYTLSPNGKVAIDVKCSDTPFKLETDNDVSSLFAFHGQVRDRLVYLLSDVRERIVPSIMEWILAQCDVNKDIEINDKSQLTLPDIQLKDADRVFRLYVKSLQDKAVYRAEESVTFNKILPDALENIIHPNKEIERKLDTLSEVIERLGIKINSNCNCNHHQ